VKEIFQTVYFIIGLVALVIGGALGYMVRKMMAESKIGSAEHEAKRILEEADRDSEAKKREALLEAKEEVHQLRSEVEKEKIGRAQA